MTRPADWQPLDDTDPVPGDPYDVAELAGRLRDTAQAIQDQARQLRAMCTDEFWDSDAGRAFRDTAKRNADHLERAFRRYDETAKALREYHPQLEEAQRQSLDALTEAKRADGERAAAERGLDAATDPADPARERLTGQRDAADAALGTARRKLDQAVELRDRAANRAASLINSAITSDALKDSRWDKFKNWVSEHAETIDLVAKIAGWVATVFGIAALLVGWIPVIGQALAAVFGAIALAATVVALVAHVLLALAGEGSWLDVVIDVVALATFGLGRAAIAGVKLGAKGVQAASRSALADDLARTAAKGGQATRRQVADAWRQASKQLGQNVNRQKAAAALSGAPKGFLPGGRTFGNAINPAAIARETWAAGKTAFSAEAWRSAVSNIRAGRVGLLDPAVATDLAALKNVPQALRSADIAKPFVSGLNKQLGTFYGSTGLGVATDVLDKAGVFDPLKPAFMSGK